MNPLPVLLRLRSASSSRRLMFAACLIASASTISTGYVHAVAHEIRAVTQDVSVTDGTRTLVVSSTVELDPDAQTLRVRGSGFDVSKGIYVGLCVVQPAGQQPSPCGGGIDKTGSSGSSAWISSNPPAYGVGLAVPYGEGGTFDVEITVAAGVNDVTDCRRVECAIVTKNDHTIISDRSQDLLVPVTFAGEAPPLPSSTTASSQDDGVSEITVSDDVGDLTDVATSSESGAGWAPIAIAVAVLAGLTSIIVIARRRSKSEQDR